MAAQPAFSLGLDFGTNSARALIVDLRSGRQLRDRVRAGA